VQRTVSPTQVDLGSPKLHLTLSHPAMTNLHRAGLYGLSMTLEQLNKQFPDVEQRPQNVAWTVTSEDIELYWDGEDRSALGWLVSQSFKLDNQGLISLTGLGIDSLSKTAKLAIHQCITSTFLQHNRLIKTEGIGEERISVGTSGFKLKYKKLKQYAHQEFFQKLCDKKGNLIEGSVGIAGWLYPGAIVRHSRFSKDTEFEEPTDLAFILLFSLVACDYYILVPDQEGTNASEYVVIIPRVKDLKARTRGNNYLGELDYVDFCVSSIGEACLRHLDRADASEKIEFNNYEQCHAIHFGKVAWSKQQKTRLDVLSVSVSPQVVEEYRRSCDCFRDSKRFKLQDGELRSVKSVFPVIASNLARGHVWWKDLFRQFNRKDFETVSYEWKGLLAMINSTKWNHETQLTYIKACHEALKVIYAKLHDRAPNEASVDIGQKSERLRLDMNRCKDVHSFRHFINNFFAQAGANQILEEHWEELLPLLTGQADWRIARDLFLLSLVTYPRIKNAQDRKNKKESQQAKQN
jgi:CRISPR-associated protein Cas8a1/Csx13